MDSPTSPTNPRNLSHNSENTEARSNLHSISDTFGFGTRSNALGEDKQHTLKGHTDEQNQAPGILDAAGVQVTSNHDDDVHVKPPPSLGDMAANRPKSEANNDDDVRVEPPPSRDKVREPNPSYEDNNNDDEDEDEDDYQRPPPMTFNGDRYRRH